MVKWSSIRRGGAWAGPHKKTSKQLRSYMDEVLKAMARGEVERGWAARRAVHGGGAPAAWVRAQALADLRQSAAQQQPAAHLARQL